MTDISDAAPPPDAGGQAEGRHRIARALAHELRTPLAVVIGNAELIADDLLEGEELHEAALGVIEAARAIEEKLRLMVEAHRTDAAP